MSAKFSVALEGRSPCTPIYVFTPLLYLRFGPLHPLILSSQRRNRPIPQGRANSPFSRNEADLPKGPAPRLSEHPDLSGYWIPSKKDRPTGNLGKDLPGFKLPFTPAGEAALKYNLEHTVDPEAVCIVGGLPRHNASGLPFQLLQGANHAVFLYWYTTYRLVPFDGRKHADDPDPSFFGEEIGSWDGDTFVIDSIAFKEQKTWADENANPHSDRTTRSRAVDSSRHRTLACRDDGHRSEVLHGASSLPANMAPRKAWGRGARILMR